MSLQNLLDAENRLVTTIGAWFPGERVVFRGKDLHKDLGELQWLDLYYFSVTGRRFSAEQLVLLSAMWTHTSYPDPRLWNNRVAALTGTARSSGTLAKTAALAVSEARVYGGGAVIHAFDLLQELAAKLDHGNELLPLLVSELRENRRLPGFGRPLTGIDERIPPLLAKAEQCGLANGRYTSLVLEAERVLANNKWRLKLNYGGLAAALFADLGFTRQEVQLSIVMAFLAGMLPCYLDALEKPQGSYLPLRCTHVCYEGRQQRCWGGREHERS